MTRGASPSRANPNQYHAFRDPALAGASVDVAIKTVKPQTATVPWNFRGALMMGPPVSMIIQFLAVLLIYSIF